MLRVVGFDADELKTLIGHDSEWFPDRYPCPVCSECMSIHTKCPEADPKCVDLTTQEAFSVFSGAGLPEEQECSATRVQELFRDLKVVRVGTRHIRGTNRCTLERIELEGGIILHLAASTHGACVYRIQAPLAFLRAIDDHHSSSQETS